MVVMTMSLLHAQTPMYFNSATQAGLNNYPFNAFQTTFSARQVSWFIAAGSLGTLPPSMVITSVYIHMGSTATVVYPTLEIKLKTSTGTGMTGIGGGPVETGFTTVLSANNYTLTTTGGQWKQFLLQTPFVWTNTSLPLVVQFQHNGTAGLGPLVYQALTTTGGNGRQWADFNGILNTGVAVNVVNFGIDGIPVVVTSTNISCSTLGTATAVTTGTGAYTYTWMPGPQTGSIATGLKPGTYTLTVHDVNNNITFTTATTFTTPVPYTGTVQNTSQLNCHGVNNGTANVVLSGGSGNSFYQWTNGINSYTTPTLNTMGIGSYSLTVTDQLTGCLQSHSFVVTQPPPLSLTLTASTYTACTNQSVTLTATLGGGVPPYTYTWTNGLSASQQSVTRSTGGPFAYTMNATDANNCPSTASINITFVPVPVLSVQSVSVCAGNVATLTASGAATYTWLPTNSSGPTFTAAPLATTVYTVVGSASACVSQSTASILFKPVPSLAFNSFSITCASLGSASVIATGGVGPFTFTWLPTNQTGTSVTGLNPNSYTVTVFDLGTGCVNDTSITFSSLIPLTGNLTFTPTLNCYGAQNGTASFSNIAGGSSSQTYSWTNGTTTVTGNSPSVLPAGSWSVTVSDVLTGCQIFSVFPITQPPAPTLNIVASNPSVCIGSNIHFSGQQSGGTAGYTYSWTNGPLVATYTVAEPSAGTYTYFLTSTDAHNCKITKSIAVDFVPNPTLSVSNISICPLATGSLIASGATSYTWNTIFIGSTYPVSPLVTTQYTVVGSALNCTTLATASVILLPTPVPTLVMSPSACFGHTLQAYSFGGNTYNWSGPGGFSSASSTPVIGPATFNHTGLYSLTVTAVNGCTAGISSNLTVNPTPTLSATGATICSSQTLQLTASSVPGAAFKWNGPMAYNTNVQNPIIVNPPVSRSGPYYVLVSGPASCTNIATVQVLIVPPPPLTGKLSSHSLCSQAFNGSPNTITLTAGGATSYTIVTAPDMSISNPGGPVSYLSPIPPNTGPGTATLSGSNGICSATMALTFSIIPNPSITVASTPVICAGQSYTYTNQGASSYTWSSTTPGLTTYNNGGIAVAHPTVNAVFSVYGGSLGCLSPSKTTTITVRPLPVVFVTPVDPRVCMYDEIELTAKGNANSYLWSPAPGLINSSGPVVNASPISQQAYTVTGELNGCYATAVTTVIVNALPQPTINTSKTIFCENEIITLIGEGGASYEWHGPDRLFFETKQISIKASSGGVYSLTVTDANGCHNTVTEALTVYNAPQGSLLGYKESGCVPLCTNYSFKSNGNTASANWSINNQTFGESFKYCYSAPGTYTIRGTFKDKTTNCSSQQDYVVTVFPQPEANFSFLPLRPVENLDEVKFTNTSTGAKQINWHWYFQNNSGYQSSEENTSYLFTEPGEYPVAFVVTDQNYCQDTVMKVVEVEPDFALFVPNAFTPNGDGMNDLFLPVVRSTYLYTLAVFDRWGQRIFYSTSPQSGWDGTFNGSESKMDVYSYQISLSTLAGEKKDYAGHVSLVR